MESENYHVNSGVLTVGSSFRKTNFSTQENVGNLIKINAWMFVLITFRLSVVTRLIVVF